MLPTISEFSFLSISQYQFPSPISNSKYEVRFCSSVDTHAPSVHNKISHIHVHILYIPERMETDIRECLSGDFVRLSALTKLTQVGSQASWTRAKFHNIPLKVSAPTFLPPLPPIPPISHSVPRCQTTNAHFRFRLCHKMAKSGRH